jgi:hypothetical protein
MASYNGAETRPGWTDTLELVVLVIFMYVTSDGFSCQSCPLSLFINFRIEVALKWVGQGVGITGIKFDDGGHRRDSYFFGRDAGWNRLDFIVVVVGLFDFLPGVNLNIGAIRVVR